MVPKLIAGETEIAKDVLVADSFAGRLMGYMFRRKPHHEAIIIKPCNSIHTFCMRFDIDVLFINSDMEVIKKIESLKPGKIIWPVKGASLVIEGSAEIFKNIKEGQRLDVKS